MKPEKWVYAAVLSCLILQNYGNYYLTDIPQELGNSFTTYFNKTPQDVEFLYSIYALFALPMTLLGGVVINAWSPRTSGLILTAMIFFSSIISWLGCIAGGETKPQKGKLQGQYWLIMFGRMVYGFAAEVNEVAQNTLINKWFDGKILSIASGLA
jgi:MFS family permease